MKSIHLQTFLIVFLFFLLKSTQNQDLFSISIDIESYKHFRVYVNSLLITPSDNLTLSIFYYTINTDSSNTTTMIYSDGLTSGDIIKQYSVWNYEQFKETVLIKISGTTNQTVPTNIIKISDTITMKLFTTVFPKSTVDGYMLPFNMFNQKTLHIFVVAHKNPVALLSYNLPPFMPTYWNELQTAIMLMPWLPFFSECEYSNSYIILNDLILPQNCSIDDQQGMLCKDRITQFNCITEQLQVSNVDNQFWFNRDDAIIFYLFPEQLQLQQLKSIKNDPDKLTTLVQMYYSNLVPVIYRRKSIDKIIVNYFQIYFTVNLLSDADFQVVTAQIIGSYKPELLSPNSAVKVYTKYLTLWQNFVLYNLSFYWYILYALAIGVVLIIFIYLIFLKIGDIKFSKKARLMLSPAIKGLLYALFSGGLFIVAMDLISYITNFDGISPLFGNELTGEMLLLNNKGRNGLILVFIGIYLLNASLQQAFKVNSQEELKIVLEDDKQICKEEVQMKQKIQFARKNMYSHKRASLVAYLLISFFGQIFAFNFLTLNPIAIALIQFLFFPIFLKLMIDMQRVFLLKELLYISGNQVFFTLSTVIYLFKSSNIYQFTYLYSVRFIIFFFSQFSVQLFIDYIMIKVTEKKQQNCLAEYIYKHFKKIIDIKVNETQYQRSLYYAALTGNRLISILLYPFAGLLILTTQKNNLLSQSMLITQYSIVYPLIIVTILVPIEIYMLFTVTQILKRSFGIRIQQVIKFNHFRFKRRKFRWMNDQFGHSRDIDHFYREFQKFAFSSQLYSIISLIAMSLSVIGLGTMMIVLSGYVLFNDPVLLPMFMIVWFTGDILSVGVSFIAVKLKLYEKKQQETMRQSLQKIQKYLKLNDSTEYLQLQGVKDYFLNYNKQWIIFSFNRVFDKQDLQENNGELISKYKYYKSIFKKKQIQEKRRIKKIKDSKDSQLEFNSQNNTETIKFNKTKFNFLAKPIMYYWFYMAKQNIYLKTIVHRVKKQKIKNACQFCNMDVELQALQKKQFYILANEYRQINVGRLFNETSFLQFYRINQQYITICLQCKDKNLHLQTKINTKGKPSKLMLRWLMAARSNILHRKQKVLIKIKEKNRNQ